MGSKPFKMANQKMYITIIKFKVFACENTRQVSTESIFETRMIARPIE